MNTVDTSKLPLRGAAVLLPRKDIDLKSWCVVACDQYTSEPNYWQSIESATTEVPSSFHLVLPEVYLESLPTAALEDRIKHINQAMHRYLAENLLLPLNPGFILVDRQTPLHPSRKGFIAAIDLEQYDFAPGNKMPIRATEGTVLERIPPRVKVRQDALLELPHTMLLLDDPEFKVVEEAFSAVEELSLPPTYQSDLQAGGGRVTGYYIPESSPIFTQMLKALTELQENLVDNFFLAVGDGNHSLATAKAHWQNLSPSLSAEEKSSHPARFALVEIVNIHDAGLDFEPIHRVVFGLELEYFLQKARPYFKNQGIEICDPVKFSSQNLDSKSQVVILSNGAEEKYMILRSPHCSLAVESLQNFLDELIRENSKLRIDYIHGEDTTRSLSSADTLGFILPPVYKADFFSTIAQNGLFPRKTFSMGEAFEKRYYLEARKIVQD